MPRWIVNCPECDRSFVYAEIAPAMIEEARRDAFQVLRKPKIPETGEKRTCPNCGTESVFKPFHLFYREDARGQASW